MLDYSTGAVEGGRQRTKEPATPARRTQKAGEGQQAPRCHTRNRRKCQRCAPNQRIHENNRFYRPCRRAGSPEKRPCRGQWEEDSMTGQQHIKAHAAAMQPGEEDSHSRATYRLVKCLSARRRGQQAHVGERPRKGNESTQHRATQTAGSTYGHNGNTRAPGRGSKAGSRIET